MTPPPPPSETSVKGAAVLAALAIGAAGCGSTSNGSQRSTTQAITTSAHGSKTAPDASFARLNGTLTDDHEFVAAIPGTDIYLGVLTGRIDGELVGGGKPTRTFRSQLVASAYACDGKTVSEWFTLAGGERRLDLVSSKGGSLTLTSVHGGLEGTIRLGSGKSYQVSVAEVPAKGKAGVYFSDSRLDPRLRRDQRAGWIVLPDGSQRGATQSTAARIQQAGLLNVQTLQSTAGIRAFVPNSFRADSY